MKSTGHPNLRRRLAVAMMVPMLLLTGLGIVSDYVVAQRLTDDAYDQSITGVAEGLAMTLERDRDDDQAIHFAGMMRTLQRIDAPDIWRYAVVDANGHLISGQAELVALAALSPTANPAFRTTTFQGHRVRVASYAYAGHNGPATIVLTETLVRRHAAAKAIVGAAVWPNAALMLLALVLVLVAVRFTFRPLDELGERMDALSTDNLAPLPLDGTPRETLPLLRALNQLLARLRDAGASQQVFLNHAAHQLRTPLATLQTQVELLHDTPPEDARARIAGMQATVGRLSHLTHQLLTLARTDRTAIGALEPGPVDVAALIERAATPLDELARGRGVILVFDLAPLAVVGVDWMLREMLINLVDNAIAHSPAGAEVVIRCAAGDDAASAGFIEVEDAGEGIPPESRERVFEPFVRLAEGRRAGTGLGLSIVRGIAERHQATILVHTGAHGTGTRIRIRFS